LEILEDLGRLREIYGALSERSLKKQLRRFDKRCRAFIARSPFLVIASSDPSGRCDASPEIGGTTGRWSTRKWRPL